MRSVYFPQGWRGGTVLAALTYFRGIGDFYGGRDGIISQFLPNFIAVGFGSSPTNVITFCTEDVVQISQLHS